MDRRKARRIAKFRAGLIIESALANGWQPATPSSVEPFSDREAELIVAELGRIAERLIDGAAP